MQQTVNQRIKILRQSLGLSQNRFASALGITPTAIAQFETERNNPSTATIAKIATTYGANMKWLLHAEGEMFTDSGQPVTVAAQPNTPLTYTRRGPKPQTGELPVVHIHHPTPTSAVIADLERLAALLAKGLLTQDEFDTLKARLLQPNP